MTKLTADMKQEMQRLRAEGWSFRRIAENFGVHRSRAQAVLGGGKVELVSRAKCHHCGEAMSYSTKERLFCSKPVCVAAQRWHCIHGYDKKYVPRERVPSAKRTLTTKEKNKQTMPALIVGDPMKVLAGRLLEESVLMYREGNEMQKLECMTFFEGEWFEALAHFVGVHPDFIRKHLEAGAKLPDALKPVEVQEGR